MLYPLGGFVYIHLCMHSCVCMCAHLCVCVHVCVCWCVRYIPACARGRVCVCVCVCVAVGVRQALVEPRACWFGKTRWPASFRDSPIFSTPALELQVSTALPAFMSVLWIWTQACTSRNVAPMASLDLLVYILVKKFFLGLCGGWAEFNSRIDSCLIWGCTWYTEP